MPVLPTWGPLLRRRPFRLLALLAVRDDERFLPGYLANVAPHVDGIVALDDGSTDGSFELLAASPLVLEVLRVPADRPAWDEIGNYRRLLAAAMGHEPDWILSLDADERLERRFRDRALRAIERGGLLRIGGLAMHLREVWDDPEMVRVDGRWGKKRVARLFRPCHPCTLDGRALHASKIPLERRWLNRLPTADLIVYHLRMLEPADRARRRGRYEQLDPTARFQPDLGYRYLTDETGLVLQRIPPTRMYLEPGPTRLAHRTVPPEPGTA
jgi:hypothetical protein